MVGNGIKHCTLGQELGVDITVVEELSEPQLTLVELGHLLAIFMDNPNLTYRGRRDMHQSGTGLQTELHAALCTAYIHVFDVGSLGEVLHVGGAVEDSVDMVVNIDFLRHVGIHHKEAGAEELLE